MIKECVGCKTAQHMVGRSNRCDGCRLGQVCVACHQRGVTRGTQSRCSTCYRKERSCTLCGAEFNGVKSLCNRCRYESSREQRKLNWDRWVAKNPSYLQKRNEAHLKAKYGMTGDDYQLMHDEQNGLCLICNQPETALDRFRKPKRLSVDHDHSTGQVRGLLCARCNPALGLFDEDIDKLLSAVRYLARFQNNQGGGSAHV